MLLDLRGHPLHSRSLSVTLTKRPDARLDARGEILDLRKRGFVPVASDLQASGVIHHMRVAAIVDPAVPALDAIETEQPTVALEPSALTRGESCRDPASRLDALAGTPLDAGFAKALSSSLGGPKGCSHVLTLAQLVGATASWALAGAPAEESSSRAPGERLFRRDLVFDATQAGTDAVQIGFQLLDLRTRPAPPIAPPMDRFARSHEIRGLAEIELRDFTLRRLGAWERRRTPDDLETAPWVVRDELFEDLAGVGATFGFAGRIFALFAERPQDQPLRDALLNLAPAFVQCVAALSEDWPARVRESGSVMGLAGTPDACYMWRRDGALHAVREQERAEGTPDVVRRRSST